MPKPNTSPDNQPAMRRLRHIEQGLIITLFLAVLWLPMLIQPTGWDPVAGLGRGEQRKPVPFPAFTGPDWSLRKFTRGLDAWCGDHFGLRRALIMANSLIDYGIFGVSPNPNVVPGRDGWLFYAGDRQNNDGNPIWDYRGVRPLSQYSLERIRWMLQDQHEWLDTRGIPYMFVLIPSKEEVHSRFLPDYITKAGSFTPREQLLRHLRRWAPGIPVLDLTPVLRKTAAMEPCFLKTDTHWNAVGGLIGAQTILTELQKTFPNITIPDENNFTRNIQRNLGGDLAAQMALDAFIQEDFIGLLPKTPPKAQPRALHNGEDPDIEAATNDTSLPRAIIYRDSYSNILIPTLSEHLQWTRFVWGRTGTEMRDVEALRPDVVLQIMADRALRLPLRYSAAMQRERLITRFKNTDNVLMELCRPDQLLQQLKPMADTKLKPAQGCVVLQAGKTEPVIELPDFTNLSRQFLPIMRISMLSPSAGDLKVAWRNTKTNKQIFDRINVRRGENNLFMALYDPELSGSLCLVMPREFNGLTIQSIEIRAFPR